MGKNSPFGEINRRHEARPLTGFCDFAIIVDEKSMPTPVATNSSRSHPAKCWLLLYTTIAGCAIGQRWGLGIYVEPLHECPVTVFDVAEFEPHHPKAPPRQQGANWMENSGRPGHQRPGNP